MDNIKDLTPQQIIDVLLKSVALADESLGMRARRDEGPARFVQKAMTAPGVVHALWPDKAAPGGYAHRIVSGEAYADRTPIDGRLAFRVSTAEDADRLALTFGDGRAPARGEPWAIALLIRDPFGGRDADGNPELVGIIDMGCLSRKGP